MAQESRMRSNHKTEKHHGQQLTIGATQATGAATTTSTAATAISAATKTTAIAHEDGDEIFEESISSPYRKVFDMAEKLATTRIGQFIIARGDRLLKVIETTAKWSLPQNQMNDKLQRPLPWLPFLMMIIALRLARVWVSFGAFLIGNAPVKAQDVVYFIQTRRRKLRALRLRGIKEICRRELDAAAARKSEHGNRATFLVQLKRIFSSAICRPGQHRETERRIMIHRGKEIICVETVPSDEQVAKRPRNNDCEADMTLDELLNKYANDDSENDSDFVPDAYGEDSNDDSKTSSEASDSSDESESQESQGNSTDSNNRSREKANNQHRPSISKEKNSSVELKENGNGKPMIMPIPMIEQKIEMSSDTETPASPKTPSENGPSSGAGNREMDVEFQFVLTPPVTLENDHKKLLASTKLASEDHRMADEIKQHLTTTVPIDLSDDIEITTNIETDPSSSSSSSSSSSAPSTCSCSPCSSPTLCGAGSSSPPFEAFIESVTKPYINYVHATETSTQDTEAQGETIASVSSSEDDFYSPIGSPPDFNTYQENQMNLRFENLPSKINHQSNGNNNNYMKSVSQKSVTEMPVVGQMSTSAALSSTSIASAAARRHQGHGQHRYRGKIRR